MQKVSDGIHVSLVKELSLMEYVRVRQIHCNLRHQSRLPCTCEKMLHVAQIILKQGYCSLSQAYAIVSPGVKYDPGKARRKLLQMPVASVMIGEAATGNSFTVLIEYTHGVNYARILSLLNGIATTCTMHTPHLEKAFVKMLLGLAQSDRERENMRYAIYKASGVTATKARRQYGFEKMSERSAKIEEVSREVQDIKEAIDEIASVQEEAVLTTFGLQLKDSEDSSSEEETDSGAVVDQSKSFGDEIETCKEILMKSEYNWFCLQEVSESKFGDNSTTVLNMLRCNLSALGFSQPELTLISESYEAYVASLGDAYETERTARALNGGIVTESESDDPEEYTRVHKEDLLSDKCRKLIAKRQMAIRRRARRQKSKIIAERRFLSRKTSKKVSKVLSECDNIGKVIETFVSEHNVGADAWRRTGVLTFDGNVKLKQKVTYESIRQHLQHVYQRHFSYGTVVQLCIARNKRRLSSQRYRGVANVTTRRARKGFSLKYNPDSHWSAAFYKGLNEVQLKDGRDVCNINRDDASGFRLDTLTTCKQYATPTVAGNDILTTRTDFVNRYSSTLQVTSYNFSSTETVAEICAGVVKAPASVHPKNPCQHSTDLQMLEKQEKLIGAFINPITGEPKSIDAIRVDGAADEGPSHEEVRYYWTERHVLKNKLATIVTTRSSGSSYMNRVELQNGCLSRAHSNTFIPSTLGGSCVDSTTGAVDKDKLKENMMLAIEAYVNRVNGCPCGNSVINLYPGAVSSEHQEVREKLLIFLKGTKKAKASLKQSDPTVYKHFQLVSTVQKNHSVSGLPSYVFYLVCCFQKECPHPRCSQAQTLENFTWYPGGPSLHYIPLPVVDSERPWGSSDCSTCKGSCFGHYKTRLVNVKDKGALQEAAKPPSSHLKALFSEVKGNITEALISNASKAVLLPPEECKLWLTHLQTVLDNRRRGARKAALTRQAKRSATSSSKASDNLPHSTRDDSDSQEWYCGSCGRQYQDETAEPETWIGCALCDRWYHCECEQISSPPPPDVDYICLKCQQ